MRQVAMVDTLNIGFIVGSAVLAWYWPFELFLFSYAVFGPLHYLTEISWLKDRQFFTSGRYDWMGLVFVTLLVLLIPSLPLVDFARWSASLLFLAFFGSLVMVAESRKEWKPVWFVLIAVVAVLLSRVPLYSTLFGILLPTLVHVLLFTGFFMLFGTLKSRSRLGFVALGFFGLSLVGLLFLSLDGGSYTVSSYVAEAYSSFEQVNLEVMNLVNIRNPDAKFAIYASVAGLSIMRMISFAYTYHYLNWFSKVRIINWHKISQLRWGFIAAFWVGAVALYVADYRVGLVVLYFLSLLHVVLEFPLNHRSFIGVWQELRGLARVRLR